MSNPEAPSSGRLGVARVPLAVLPAAGVVVLAALVLVTLAGVQLGAEPSSTPRLDWLLNRFVSSTTRLGNTLSVAGEFTAVAPTSGTLSPFFQLSSTTGAALAGLPTVNDSVSALAADGAGGSYVSGRFTNIGSARPVFAGQPSPWRTAHVLANGSVDPAFQPQFGGEVGGMLRVGPSLIVFGRLFVNGGTTARELLAVNPVTGVLSAWVPVPPGFASGIATAIGPLFVSTWEGTHVRRVNAFDGTTGAALWTSAPITSASSARNGFLGGLAAAGSRVVIGVERLYALDATTGAIEPAWGGPGGGAADYVAAVAINGSTVFAGGQFSVFQGQPRAHLAAVDLTTGGLLPWSPQASWTVSHVATSPGGTVFVAPYGDTQGLARVNGEARRASVFEIDAAGALTPWESQAQFAVVALHVSPTGALVFGASAAATTGTATRLAIAGFDTATGALVPNTPTLTAGTTPARAFVASVGQTLFMSGWFDTVNGQPRANLAAVDSTTNTLLSWPAAGCPVRPGSCSPTAAGSTCATTASFAIPGAPPGVYVLRVRAITSAGSGAPSSDVVVMVP